MRVEEGLYFIALKGDRIKCSSALNPVDQSKQIQRFQSNLGNGQIIVCVQSGFCCHELDAHVYNQICHGNALDCPPVYSIITPYKVIDVNRQPNAVGRLQRKYNIFHQNECF